jgi:predicted O-methyltransferase YrrM
MTRTDTLHAAGAADWDISEEVLDVIAREVRPGARTIETGAGRSTIEIARRGALHDCITPSADEIARIIAHCEQWGVELDRVRFHRGYSQDVLPALDTQNVELALIDGGHGFPIPAIDFQYIAPRLATDGLLLIDDVDLWTGAMLVDFLRGEKETFHHEWTIRGRTAVFRVLKPYAAREWTNQPAVVRKSRWRQARRKVMNGLGHLLHGEFSEIFRKVGHERRLAQAAQADY